jgi:hypothetical protein
MSQGKHIVNNLEEVLKTLNFFFNSLGLVLFTVGTIYINGILYFPVHAKSFGENLILVLKYHLYSLYEAQVGAYQFF